MHYDSDEFIDRDGNVIVTTVAFYPYQFDHHVKSYLVDMLNQRRALKEDPYRYFDGARFKEDDDRD